MALSEVYPILRRTAVLFCILFCGIVSSARAASFPPAEEPIQGFGLVDAFPGIQFNQPVVITSPPGETNSLFVVERLGKLFAITNLSRSNKTLLLDITPLTASDGGYEPGLLGMAFHPNFRSNGFFFLYRTLVIGGDGFYDRLSRFRADPKTFVVDPSSERIVLQQRDLRYIQHNAGDIHFGPDGYLYLSLGESSPPEEDYRLTRQPIDKNFFGVMLRIDVDKRPGNLPPNPHPGISDLYLVPKDNPFVGATEYQGVPLNSQTLRTEIFALGLRNPWRFCFDPVSAEIYCGDVGEQTYEEVNLIRAGVNYGWPYLEGPMQTEYFPIRPSGFSSEPPLWSYLHQPGSFAGQAVIGGCVYNGTALPGLQRAFIFGDNVRGHIWALTRDRTQGTSDVKWLAGEPSVSTFGLDPRDNEILLASLITGKIRKLVYRDPAASTFPTLLSQTGLFRDTRSLTPAPDVTPYEVNAPFWSDYAIKKRWFVLPKNTYFTLTGNSLAAPAGTIWIKHFELETIRNNPQTRRRLETRLLIKGNSGAYGLTYKWNSAGTDAELVPGAGMDEDISVVESGVSRLQTWHYPSRGECRLCHNPLVGDALGFSGEQLNCPDAQSGVNQLAAYAGKSYLKGYDETAPPQPLAVPTNTNFSVEYRVRSFMQANCAQCHFPGNPIVAHWDARFHTLLDQKQLSGLIQPGQPGNSVLFTRLAVRDLLHMPPVATSEINNDALTLFSDWISGIPSAPWQDTALGTPIATGTSLVWSNSVETTAYPGASGTFAGEYIFRPSTGSVHLVTRITARQLTGPSTRAGIRFSSLNKDGPVYFAGVTSGGLFSQNGQEASISHLSTVTDPIWVRVAADPTGIRLFRLNGQNWENIETVSNAFDNVTSVGLAVTSAEDNSNEQFARFENVSVLSASLRLLEGSTNQPVQEQSQLECVLAGQNFVVQKVEFFADDQFLGETRSAPYTMAWATNVPGTYQLTARVTTQRGFMLTTPPFQINVSAPSAEGWFLTEDTTTQGDWQKRYGGINYLTPTSLAWPKETVALTFLNNTVRPVDSSIATQTLLKIPDSSARSTSYWSGAEFTISMTFFDALLHKVSLYVVPPAGGKTTVSMRDQTSREILAARTVNGGVGTYLSFFVKGGVDFVLSGNPEAALYGIFLDASPFPPPTVALGLLPPAIFASSTLRINPNAGTNASVSKMDFYVDGLRRRTLSNPPYSFVITNLAVGSHTLQVTATDQQGQSADANATLQVLVPPSAAKFLGTDDYTRGDWQARYGREGYLIVGGGTNFPVSAEFSVTNQTVYTFNYPLNDLTRLVSPEDGSRLSSVWTSSFFVSFDLTLNDGLAHQIALYVFDMPGVFREELVRVVDPNDGRVLSETSLKNFESGRYYRWSVQGSVRFQIQAKAGSVLLGAIFLDPITARFPGVTIFSPPTGTMVAAPSRLSARLLFLDPDNLVQRTEFYFDNLLFTEFPYRADVAELPAILSGSHWLSAAAVDYLGSRRWSPPMLLTGQAPPAEAQFLFADRNTGGGWKGNYGNDGSVIAADSDNFPAFASYDINPPTVWIWTGSSTNKEALLRNGNGQVAAAWYDGSASRTLNLKTSFSDGEPHTVSLYFLDYQSGERVLSMNVLDTVTSAVLDKQTLSSFDKGAYLSWRVKGNVTFQIKSKLSTPVVSGIFVDAGLTYQAWLTNYFPTLLTAGVEIPNADPDNDGMPNQVEFLTGLNPLRAEPLWAYYSDIFTGEVTFELDLARNRDGASPVVEYTSDLKHWSSADDLTPVVRLNQTQRVLQYRFPASQRGTPLYFRLGAIDTTF